MEKTTKRIIGIVVGFLLWAFLFIKVEFGFFCIYYLLSYNVNDISSVITLICVDSRNGTIKVINANGDEKHAIVLEAPDLFRNMVVAGEQRYLVSYDYEKNNPNVGRLSGLTILTKEVQEQAHFVSSFFDIYENSFD